MHKEEAVWQERAAAELERIRSREETRRQEDVSRAWRANRWAWLGGSGGW